MRFAAISLGDSRYDAIVWSLLNDVAPTDEEGLTRKDRLIPIWIALKRTDVTSEDLISQARSCRPAPTLCLTSEPIE